MQTKSRVTHFVAGGSTGGTISGTGRFLKDMNPSIKVMLPDPVGSVFWDYWANRKAQKELKPKSYQVRTSPFVIDRLCMCVACIAPFSRQLSCVLMISCAWCTSICSIACLWLLMN